MVAGPGRLFFASNVLYPVTSMPGWLVLAAVAAITAASALLCRLPR